MATAAVPLRGLRERYNDFIERHEVAWELGMAVLAVVFVAIGFWGDTAPPAMRAWLDELDIALTLVFVAEFASRFAAAYDRRAYLREHWIDLIALVPTWTRGVRLLRLLRLLRLVRAFAGLYRALTGVQRFAHHRGLIWLFCAWLGVAAISSTMLYLAEEGQNPAITTPFDALWWGIVTMATVGYGDVVPVTPEGRLAAGLLMLLGITLFAAITGAITSYFVSTDGEQRRADEQDPVKAMQQLRELLAQHLITEEEFEAKRAEILGRL
ncbi:MAG: ion transporter [Chloroflexota bacterium]|nr:ion transporter [Chloroflexota bacterium]